MCSRITVQYERNSHGLTRCDVLATIEIAKAGDRKIASKEDILRGAGNAVSRKPSCHIISQKVRYQLCSFLPLWSMNRYFGFLEKFESLCNTSLCPFSPRVTTNFEYGCYIATPITIVRGTPYSHKTLVKVILATFHNQLVRPCNERQSIYFVKFVCHALAKQPPRPSWGHLPRNTDVFRIAPHQIAKSPFVRDFLIAVNRSHLIQRPDIWGESPVYAQHLFVNEGGQTKAIETLDAMPPRGCVAVLAQTFIIKAVYLSDLSTLVIAAQQRHVARILEFEAQQQCQSFDAVVTPIDKVAEEDVRSLRRPASHLQ